MTPVSYLENTEQVRAFIKQRNIQPGQAGPNGAPIDTNAGDGGISLREINAAFGADGVVISASAWAAVAGTDGVLNNSEATAIINDSVTHPQTGQAEPAPVNSGQLLDAWLAASRMDRANANLEGWGEKFAAATSADSPGGTAITQGEFEEMTGQPITDAAWQTYFGGGAVSASDMKAKLLHLAEFFSALGGKETLLHGLRCHQFDYIASGIALESMFWSMDPPPYNTMQLDILRRNLDLLREMGLVQGTGEVTSEQLEDILEKFIENRDASPDDLPPGEQAGGLVRTFMYKAMFALEATMRARDMDFPELTEPLAAQYFLQTATRDYLLDKQDLPTKAEVARYTQYNKNLAGLKALNDPAINMALDKARITPQNVNKFEQLMHTYEQAMADGQLSDTEKASILAGLQELAPTTMPKVGALPAGSSAATVPVPPPAAPPAPLTGERTILPPVLANPYSYIA